jgi:hypothetical protein
MYSGHGDILSPGPDRPVIEEFIDRAREKPGPLAVTVQIRLQAQAAHMKAQGGVDV